MPAHIVIVSIRTTLYNTNEADKEVFLLRCSGNVNAILAAVGRENRNFHLTSSKEVSSVLQTFPLLANFIIFVRINIGKFSDGNAKLTAKGLAQIRRITKTRSQLAFA